MNINLVDFLPAISSVSPQVQDLAVLIAASTATLVGVAILVLGSEKILELFRTEGMTPAEADRRLKALKRSERIRTENRRVREEYFGEHPERYSEGRHFD
jgi:hypothetical protein